MTRQQAAIVERLRAARGFLSAAQIYEALRADGQRTGLATVYRTLQALSDSGAVDVLRPGGGEATYRLCGDQGHHHHLTCRGCGRSYDIAGPDIESWSHDIAAQFDFIDPSHTLEVYGTCPDCRD